MSNIKAIIEYTETSSGLQRMKLFVWSLPVVSFTISSQDSGSQVLDASLAFARSYGDATEIEHKRQLKVRHVEMTEAAYQAFARVAEYRDFVHSNFDEHTVQFLKTLDAAREDDFKIFDNSSSAAFYSVAKVFVAALQNGGIRENEPKILAALELPEYLRSDPEALAQLFSLNTRKAKKI